MSFIDAHIHLWKFDQEKYGWIGNDMAILRQDFLPGKLEQTLHANGVNGCIAVQAHQSEWETHFLVEMAQKYSFIKGVVGWIDLQKENLEQRLDYFGGLPHIAGWRHVAQDEPDDFLQRSTVVNGIKKVQERGYAYDILIFEHQLPAALHLANACPDGRFILDHCAKPAIKKGGSLQKWAEGIKAFAEHPGMFCKLSGLLTEASWKSWSPKDFYPYLDVVFEHFGTSRLLFGSDWPVMLVAGMYVQWKSLLLKYMEQLSPEEVDGVMGKNALKAYQIQS